MLYSKKQRVWLPLYLPLNRTFIYIGHGALLLTPIVGESKFLGSGDYDGMGAATCNEDLEMMKQKYLKCNDVINGDKVPERFECFERIKFARRRLFGYLKYPFTIDSSLFSVLHGNSNTSQNSRMYNIFDEVNHVYIKNQNKKERDVRNMCFLWDRRCIGIGGREDPGLTKILKLGLRSTELAELQLYDLSVFVDFRVTMLQKEDGEMNEEIRRKKKRGEFVTMVEDIKKVLNPTFYKAMRLNHTTFVRWGSKSPQYKEWSKLYGEKYESDNNSEDDKDKDNDKDEESSRNKKRKVGRISHHEEETRRSKKTKRIINDDVIESAISSASKQIRKQYRSNNSSNTSPSSLKKKTEKSRKSLRAIKNLKRRDKRGDNSSEIEPEENCDTEYVGEREQYGDGEDEQEHMEEAAEIEDGRQLRDGGEAQEHMEEVAEIEDREEEVVTNDTNNRCENSNNNFENENSNEDDETNECVANDVHDMQGYILKTDQLCKHKRIINEFRMKLSKGVTKLDNASTPFTKSVPYEIIYEYLRHKQCISQKRVYETVNVKKINSGHRTTVLNLKEILDNEYSEHLVEVSLDDIEIPLMDGGINEEHLDRAASLLSCDYQITKGVVTVYIAPEELTSVTGSSIISWRSADSRNLIKIVDGRYRIIYLKIKNFLSDKRASKLTVSVVKRKDGNKLNSQELTTVAARKQMSSVSNRTEELHTIIKVMNEVCDYLYFRNPNILTKSNQWFQKQMKCTVGTYGKNVSTLRNYVTVAKSCFNDTERRSVIEKCLYVYPDIGISHISREDVLKLSPSVLRLYLITLSRAMVPSLKKYNTDSNCGKRKRKDKRNKVRRLPPIKVYISRLLTFITEFIDNLDRLLQLFQKKYVEDIIYLELEEDDEDENDEQKHYMEQFIADYISDIVFEEQIDGMARILQLCYDRLREKSNYLHMTEDADKEASSIIASLRKSTNNDGVSASEYSSDDSEGELENDEEVSSGKNNEDEDVTGDIAGLQESDEPECVGTDVTDELSSNKKVRGSNVDDDNLNVTELCQSMLFELIDQICDNNSAVTKVQTIMGANLMDIEKSTSTPDEEDGVDVTSVTKSPTAPDHHDPTEPRFDSDDVPNTTDLKHFLSNEEIDQMDISISSPVPHDVLKIQLPQSLWKLKSMRHVHMRKWLRHLLIPSKHRINQFCTYRLLEMVHFQLFYMAAENYIKGEKISSIVMETIDLTKQNFCDTVTPPEVVPDVFGMNFFASRKQELMDNGFTILKGFTKNRSILQGKEYNKNVLSFKVLEEFIHEMPVTSSDGTHLWDQLCRYENDYDDGRENETGGQYQSSTHAVMGHMDVCDQIWKQRAVLDLSIAMLIKIMDLGSWKENKSPDILLPNTGGRFMRTISGCPSQGIHVNQDSEHVTRSGYFVIVSGRGGFPTWFVTEAQSIVSKSPSERATMDVECRKCFVDPYSILIARNDMVRVAGSHKDGVVYGNISYHVRFGPVTSNSYASDNYYTRFRNINYME